MKFLQLCHAKFQAGVQACKDAVQKVVSAAEKVSAVVSVLVLSAFVASGANAQLPEEVTDVFTDLAADAALLFAVALALWGTIRGFFAIMKLGSKFLSKAGT
jgi:hypothetical protein